MENKEKVNKKIKELTELIKIIREENNDSLIIDKKGNIYKISKSDYFLLKIILKVKDYDSIKRLLKSKFNKEKDFDMFIDDFLNRYINTLNSEKKMSNLSNKKEEINFFEKNNTLKTPLVVSLQLLETCNLKCRHCYTMASNDKKTVLDLNLAKSVVEQLHELKVFRLGLTGGETLLYKNIEEIIKLASKYKIITTITTNGILLTEEKAKKLKQAGLNHIHVSIDGDKNIHNNIRGSNKSFDKAIEAIEICKKVGIKVEINYTLMKSNIECFDNMIRLAKKYNIQINVRRLIPTGRGKEDLKDLLNYNECEEILNKIIDNSYNNIKLDYCFFNKNQYRGNCKTNNKCILTINSEGNVYTCPYLQYDEFIIGNIKENSIKSIYTKVKDSKLVNFDKNNLKKPCNTCEMFNECYGGWRAHAYILYNDLYDLDIQCEKCYKEKYINERKK